MRIIADGIYYACGLTLAGLALSYFWTPLAGAPLYVAAGFCLYFFRDPERVAPAGNVMVAPADGKVVSIRKLSPTETRVSIFLNIFDVHVNRTPLPGLVTEVVYRKGRFRVASLESASLENEQNTLVVSGAGSTVVCRQIAGLIARRIVCYKHAGQRVLAGERIGYIKFGSRVDVIFGPEWASAVKVGDRVKAGASVLATPATRRCSMSTAPHSSFHSNYPASSRRIPRRAAYALPTLFTSGNIFLGFLAISQAFQGALQAQAGDFGANAHFDLAAKALGFAIFFDGLDGRIARMTNTTSDFGRELDSLADFITFAIAPAVLAFLWGVLFVVTPFRGQVLSQLMRAGYLVAFLYLLCGAVRLARFNVQTNPKPANPGRPDRRYFVGLPSPAAAAVIAAVVFMDTAPVRSFAFAIMWLALIVIVALLMVSRWRYPSFKQINITKPRTPLIVLIVAGAFFLIWNWAQPVLLASALAYFISGIAIRIGGWARKYRRSSSHAHLPERQVG